MWQRSVLLILVLCVNVQCGQADEPFLIVLGVAQDGGVPQAGSQDHDQWRDPGRTRHVACLAIVDPRSAKRWMIDCTPDFPEQLHALDETAPPDEERPGLDGIFLTHGHMGHYTGLIYVGHEVMGSKGVPVYAMPRMHEFLSTNGPWDQLVRYENIVLHSLEDGTPVELTSSLTVTPILVPHRQEYTEVVGYRIEGPRQSVLYIPDIDSWEEFDEAGGHIESLIEGVDVAYLDATFFSDSELPGRDMSGFPHPFITHSMKRFASLPETERAKVRFIHLNHTNPALWAHTDARKAIESAGFLVAEELERLDL